METSFLEAERYNDRVIRSRLQLLLAQKADRERRKRYTLREVAQATGLSKDIIAAYINNTVGRYENSTLESLCAWLGCQVGDLLVREPDEPTAAREGEQE